MQAKNPLSRLLAVMGMLQMIAVAAWAQGRATTATAEKPAVAPKSEVAPTPPSIGLWGQHGLYRSYSSDLKGQAMSLTLSGNFELSYARNAMVSDDRNSRIGGHLGVLFIPLEFLEVSATYHMLINSNDKPTSGSEATLQLLGDATFDVRGAYSLPLAGGRLGISLGPQFRLMSGSKGLYETDAFSFGVILGTSYVFPKSIPLKLHFNFGVFVDRTRFLLEGFRTSGDSASSLADLYGRVDGAAISAYGMSAFGLTYLFRLGVEVPLKNVVPWIEYALDLQTASEFPTFSSDRLNAGDHPQHLVLGARAFVTRDRAFTVGGALDFGFNGGRFANTVGVPGQLPWTFIINVAYTFGRASELGPGPAPPPIIVERDPTGTLRVKVIDEQTKSPLGDTEVYIDKKRVMTDKDGQITEKLLKGTVILRAERFSHLPSAKRAAEIKAGMETEVEFTLSRRVNQTGLLIGQVSDARGKPLRATVVLNNGQVRTTCDPDGKFSVALPPGKYQIEISYPGHIRFNRVVEIKPDKQAISDVTLHVDN
ncbi:MAG: carboxypeptidase regulatory-like domain-containing protein [Deltaproteobacteria bacterium]|nr:carboxypeptidase regulatory-like domain-containing protein [Deltaproteobacteria bacterium]